MELRITELLYTSCASPTNLLMLLLLFFFKQNLDIQNEAFYIVSIAKSSDILEQIQIEFELCL